MTITLHAPLHLEVTPGLLRLEVASTFQIPGIQIVGLPGAEVQEARERIRCAIEASGLEIPRRKLILNLSPAGVRKSGTGLDLALALGVLLSEQKPEEKAAEHWCAWGELGLDGRLKPVGQIYRALRAAAEAGIAHVLLAPPDASHAQSLQREFTQLHAVKIHSVPTLRDAVACVREGRSGAKVFAQPTARLAHPPSLIPLSQTLARLAGVSAAANLHALVLGPRGAGKSQFLEWLAALDPGAALSRAREENLLVSELREPYPHWQSLPLRRVGVAVRPTALLGSAGAAFNGATGLARVRPGECSLAHGGVLIADEFPEWARDAREALREPLERGRVSLTTARCAVELPARFRLAASGNLCPCGAWPSPADGAPCSCADTERRRYRERLSGPILDRMDIVILLRARPELAETASPADLSSLAEHAQATQRRLIQNWGAAPGELTGANLEALLNSHPAWLTTLAALPWQSLRSRHKILKLALSLAAWDGADQPSPAHWMEALRLRPETVLHAQS